MAALSISSIIVAVVAMSKSFLGTYFGGASLGATEMVEPPPTAGWREKAGHVQSRAVYHAGFRDYVYYLLY